jgi:hypothetical protein
MICKRKGCNQELPEKAYHFASQLALEEGYCSYVCWMTDQEEECKQAVVDYINAKKNPDSLPDNRLFFLLRQDMTLEELVHFAKERGIVISDILAKKNHFTMKHDVACRIFTKIKERREK